MQQHCSVSEIMSLEFNQNAQLESAEVRIWFVTYKAVKFNVKHMHNVMYNYCIHLIFSKCFL